MRFKDWIRLVRYGMEHLLEELKLYWLFLKKSK